MAVRPPDPDGCTGLLHEIRMPVHSLIRFSTMPANEPWWSHDRFRFDGSAQGPSPFGTCYAAESLLAAFAETVIHDCEWFRFGAYRMSKEQILSRHIVEFARPHRPLLSLANLTGPALKAMGLNNDVSAGAHYEATQFWAQIIHRTDQRCDGLLYVSRQCNDARAIALFERSRVRVARSKPLSMGLATEFCQLFGVVTDDYAASNCRSTNGKMPPCR